MQGAHDGIDVRLLTSGIPYQRMSEDFSEEEVRKEIRGESKAALR